VFVVWFSFYAPSWLYHQSSRQLLANVPDKSIHIYFLPRHDGVRVDASRNRRPFGNRLSATRQWGRIWSGWLRNLRGFSEKLHIISWCLDDVSTDPYAIVALPPRQCVGRLLEWRSNLQTGSSPSRLYRLTMTAGPPAPTLHCPFVAMKQPLRCTVYPPHEAATTLRRVCSAIKQPLCCAACLPQWSCHHTAPRVFRNKAATVLRRLSSAMKLPPHCAACVPQ
jgi:hypothetical protein